MLGWQGNVVNIIVFPYNMIEFDPYEIFKQQYLLNMINILMLLPNNSLSIGNCLCSTERISQ